MVRGEGFRGSRAADDGRRGESPAVDGVGEGLRTAGTLAEGSAGGVAVFVEFDDGDGSLHGEIAVAGAAVGGAVGIHGCVGGVEEVVALRRLVCARFGCLYIFTYICMYVYVNNTWMYLRGTARDVIP